jgi:hypothetical protein
MVAIVSAALGECAHAAPLGLAERAGTMAITGGFAGNIASDVARKMLLEQLRLVFAAVCVSLTVCVLAGVFVHSLLVHYEQSPAWQSRPVLEDRDHAG